MHTVAASLDQLQARLLRLHASVASTSTFEIPVFQSPRLVGSGTFSVEFTDGRSLAEMENVLGLLIANIASLKDHLKMWCAEQGVSFPGDALIERVRAVALVHDLWNRDKHGALDRPRSGCKPLVRDVHQSLGVEPIDGPGSSVEGRFNPETGETRVFPGPNTRLSIVIDGEIVDELGNKLGGVLETCAMALDAWENTMATCGVPR
jgi:hypothetical protein